MKIKTSNLTGAALDWAVATCEGYDAHSYMRNIDIIRGVNGKCTGIQVPTNRQYVWFAPSKSWADGGPIIEREGIELICNLTATEAARFKEANADWQAFYRDKRSTEDRSFSTTPLVAAMKAFVRRRLGDEIDLPEGLV
jgi:hypothetical protein